MKIFKRITTLFTSLSILFLSSPLLAETVNPKAKLKSVGDGVGLNGNFSSWTGTIISGVLVASALVFLIMIFYAGLLWLLAQGEAAKIQKAKTLMVYSILGVVIMFLAYSFTYFLFNNILGGKT